MKVICKQTRKLLWLAILTAVTVFHDAVCSCRSVPTLSRVVLPLSSGWV